MDRGGSAIKLLYVENNHEVCQPRYSTEFGKESSSGVKAGGHWQPYPCLTPTKILEAIGHTHGGSGGWYGADLASTPPTCVPPEYLPMQHNKFKLITKTSSDEKVILKGEYFIRAANRLMKIKAISLTASCFEGTAYRYRSPGRGRTSC